MTLQTFLIINSISNIFCLVAGYYICHRGAQGVKSDLADVAMDVKNIKTKVTAIKAAA